MKAAVAILADFIGLYPPGMEWLNYKNFRLAMRVLRAESRKRGGFSDDPGQTGEYPVSIESAEKL
jgi:hypothetical protein